MQQIDGIMMTRVQKRIDELKKQFMLHIYNLNVFSVYKYISGFELEKIADCMFYDVIISYYTEMLNYDDFRGCKVENLPKTKNNDAEINIWYTTYIKIKKKYRRLFRNKSEFIDSEAEREINKKFFRQKIAKVNTAPMLFLLYMINELYIYCIKSNDMSIINSFVNVTIKYIQPKKISNTLRDINKIFNKIIIDKNVSYYYFLHSVGGFFKDLKKDDVINKISIAEYSALIMYIAPVLLEVYCVYAGILINYNLTSLHKNVIESKLQNIAKKDIPLFKATDLVWDRFNIIKKTPEFSLGEDDIKGIINSKIEEYVGIMAESMDATKTSKGMQERNPHLNLDNEDTNKIIEEHKKSLKDTSDINIKTIERIIYEEISALETDRQRRKHRKNIKRIDENLTIEKLLELLTLIDSGDILIPKDIKEILIDFRKNAVRLQRNDKYFSLICAEMFQQAYIICKAIDENTSADIYHAKRVLTCISDILYSKIKYEGTEQELINVINYNLAYAFRIILSDGIKDIINSSNIHTSSFIIGCISRFIIENMETSNVNYEHLSIITHNILKEANLLQKQLAETLTFDLMKENISCYLEMYIRKNNIITESLNCLRDIFDLDICEDELLNDFGCAF